MLADTAATAENGVSDRLWLAWERRLPAGISTSQLVFNNAQVCTSFFRQVVALDPAVYMAPKSVYTEYLAHQRFWAFVYTLYPEAVNNLI